VAIGQVTLRKVEPQEKAPAAVSHLDLIKSRAWQLRKVDTSAPRPAVKPKHEEKPSDQLSLQEILQKAAQIREQIACSDSGSSSSGSSSTVW
jgi:hypothetical protein